MDCVKHLVLSGGGFKGIAFCGVIECLQRRNSLNLKNVRTFAGASAGAVLALVLAIGYTNAEAFKYVYDLDFTSLVNPRLDLLLSQYGIETGDKFVHELSQLLSRRGIATDITLAGLFAVTGKRLVITVSCLGKGVRYLDHITEPDISVITAVRMSVAVPLLVTPVYYKGDYYVDGGLLDNAPIALFLSEPVCEVLTIQVDMQSSAGPINTSGTVINNIEDYIGLMFVTILKELNTLRLKGTRHDKASIWVKCGGHKIPTTIEDKKELFKIGFQAAKDYIASNSYLELRIDSLPYPAMRNVWKNQHQKNFANTLAELIEIKRT